MTYYNCIRRVDLEIRYDWLVINANFSSISGISLRYWTFFFLHNIILFRHRMAFSKFRCGMTPVRMEICRYGKGVVHKRACFKHWIYWRWNACYYKVDYYVYSIDEIMNVRYILYTTISHSLMSKAYWKKQI